jgi:hypothetical protein
MNGMGFPRVPGGGKINTPQSNQFAMKLNVMALPNGKCVKCGCEDFISRANIKMISPLQSPDGQWAHGIASWWACLECGHKFDPKEWIEKNDKEKKEEPVIVLPDAKSADA